MMRPFGAASDVTPKFVLPSDPAAQWTGAMRGAAFFAYADNYLIDVKFGVIMDVEASRAIRQAEVGASQTMIERTEACFGIKPAWLAADTAYGSAANLDWLVNQQRIAPHVPVIDKSQREDGTFSREDFVFDQVRDIYTCPAGKTLATTGHVGADHTLRYIGSVPECRARPARLPKQSGCPNVPVRQIKRDVNEAARDTARALAKTEASSKIAPLSARRSRRCSRILRASCGLIDCRLRGPSGAQFEFTLAAIAQNLRRLAKLVVRPPPVTSVACVA